MDRSPQTCITVKTNRSSDASITLLSTQKPNLNPMGVSHKHAQHRQKNTSKMHASLCGLLCPRGFSSQQWVLSNIKGNGPLTILHLCVEITLGTTHTEDLNKSNLDMWGNKGWPVTSSSQAGELPQVLKECFEVGKIFGSTKI